MQQSEFERLRDIVIKKFDLMKLDTDKEHFSNDVVVIDDMMHSDLEVFLIKISDECYYVGNCFMPPNRFDNQDLAIEELVRLFKLSTA